MDLREIIAAMKTGEFIVLGPDGWVCGTCPIDEAQQSWLMENGFLDSTGFVNGYQHFTLSMQGQTVDLVDYMTSK